MDFVSLSLAKKYVDDTANALGAVKGANATIESITPVEGGNNVVFAWVGTDGTKQTQTLFVANGKQGERGEKGDPGGKGDPGEKGDPATDAQVSQAVNEWLDEHPEATTVIADDTVTPDMTTFFKKTTTYGNLFDKDNCESGVVVKCNSTADGTHGSANACPAFPVTPGKSYYIGKANGTLGATMCDKTSWAFYDKDMNKVVQSTPSAMGGWNPIPDGVAFMRVSVYYWAGVTDTMVVEGTEAPTKYVSYTDGIFVDTGWKDDVLREAIVKDAAKYVAENVEFHGDRILDETLSFEKNDWATVYNMNLANPDEFVADTAINQYGNAYASTGNTTTGYCPVVAGKRYFANTANWVCWFDKDKKIIKATNENPLAGTVAPDNACYVRFHTSSALVPELNDRYYIHYAQPYGTQIAVVDDALVASAMNDAVSSCGNIAPFTMERWNLVDAAHKIHGNFVADTGTWALFNNGGNFTGYIVDVVPGTEYVFRVYNNNSSKIIQYDADWNFISMVEVGSYVCKYTAEENVAHAIFGSNVNGFVAVSDETKNRCLKYLSERTNGLETNLAARYIPVGIEKYMSNAVVEELLTDKSDLLLQKIHNSKGLKWACLGDSLTTLSWGSNMYNIVADKLGITPVNYGIVSSTIADYQQDGVTGNPMCVRYAEMDDDADIVTVMGVVNDAHSKIGTMVDRGTDTVYGACHTLFPGLINKYPNAKIGVILTPQYGKGVPEYIQTQGGDPNLNNLRDKVNAVREVAEYYSLPVCDLFNHGGIAGTLPSTIGRLLQADYLHITTEGYKVLSRPLLAFIEDLIG